MLNRRDFGLAAMIALLAGAGGICAPPPAVRDSMELGIGDNSFFRSRPYAIDTQEKQILDVIQEMLPERGMGVHQNDGRLLRMLAQFSNAQNVVEIGTFHGMSALWLCMGLQKTGGRLITHEIDPEAVRVAQANFGKAGITDLVTVVVGDAHEKVDDVQGPIDILFQDADKKGYLDYFEKLLPKVRTGGLIVSHNINPVQADPKYLERITTDPKLDTVLATLQEGGICLTLKKQTDPKIIIGYLPIVPVYYHSGHGSGHSGDNNDAPPSQ